MPRAIVTAIIVFMSAAASAEPPAEGSVASVTGAYTFACDNRQQIMKLGRAAISGGVEALDDAYVAYHDQPNGYGGRACVAGPTDYLARFGESVYIGPAALGGRDYMVWASRVVSPKSDWWILWIEHAGP